MVKSNQITIEDLNKSWLGLIVFHLFVINLRNLVKNKLFICREYHISPSEIDKMQYWEFEWYTDNIQEINKEEEKRQKAQEKEQAAMKSSMNPRSMMSSISSSMPKMPTMGTMPSINMPRI